MTPVKPNEAQKRFLRTVVGSGPKKPSPKKLGKLTPTDRPTGRIAPARYVPMCLSCGGPRGRTRGLKCEECTE